MSIVFDFADIAARMNCNKPDERPVVFTGVECGSTGSAGRLSSADFPPYTTSSQVIPTTLLATDHLGRILKV